MYFEVTVEDQDGFEVIGIGQAQFEFYSPRDGGGHDFVDCSYTTLTVTDENDVVTDVLIDSLSTETQEALSDAIVNFVYANFEEDVYND